MKEKLYDIFISYSSEDQKLVEAMCHYLEERNLRCFVAYRDVPKGKDWAPYIEKGIEDSKVLVYVHTEASNSSEETTREIVLAIAEGCIVIPFRVSPIRYGEGKKYRLNNLNWLDAFPQDPENYFGDLFDILKVNFSERIKKEEEDGEKLQDKQPQPRTKPKPVQTDFNTEYNRCMTTKQYPEAFAACLNEAVLRQNVSSIITKANSVIANLKGRILIPDCVAHVSYDWLTYRLSAKGYSPIKTHEDSISYKKIRFRISKTSSNITQVNIGWHVNMFLLLLFFFVYFLSLVFAIGAVGTFFESRVWVFNRKSFILHLILVFVFIFILIFLSITIVRFFKRKKKAISDMAKICLEECER